MNELFLPYKLALLAKKHKFDKPCLARFIDDGNNTLERWDWDIPLRNSTNEEEDTLCTAPLYQQIVDWFDSKGIFISIDYAAPDTNKFGIRIDCYTNGRTITDTYDMIYTTRQEALIKAILEAFTLIDDTSNTL